MRRCLLFIWLLSATASLRAETDPARLALELTGTISNDRQKAEVIFRWIAQNISYTIRTPQRFPRPYSDEFEAEGPLPPLDERVARDVLRRGTALCDGYARLFYTLCRYAGLQAAVIRGYARPREFSEQTRFGINHFWNAVWLEGRWQLLDLTWASGYLSRQGDRFIRHLDETYFLTPPELFIEDHYPDDPRWTLLEDARFPREFQYSAFRLFAFTKYGFVDYFPARGLLRAAPGDTLRFRLRQDLVFRENAIAPAVCSEDSACYPRSAHWVYLDPVAAEGGIFHYQWVVPSAGERWICLQVNGDAVLRYRLRTD